MISFSRPVDTDVVPSEHGYWRTSVREQAYRFRTTAWCIGSIVLAACQSESPSSLVHNQAEPQQQSSIVTDSQVTELTFDSLFPPPAATLSISSVPGFIDLTWDSIPDQQSATVYQLDTVEGLEVLVAQGNDMGENTVRLPSRTHQRAWHSEQFRVELCNRKTCISSPRMLISTLAAGSARYLYPSVFVQDEKFADRIAFNTTASLMAVSLPVQGVIDLYIKSDNLWLSNQRILLDSEALSLTRTISLSLSPSGDTLAVLINDTQSDAEIKILERLGEAWFETTSLRLEKTVTPTISSLNRSSSDAISISTDSHRILAHLDDRLVMTTRATSGWTTPTPLHHSEYDSLNDTFDSRFSTSSVFKAASANGAHTRIFTVHTRNRNLLLSVWENSSENSLLPIWTRVTTYPIDNVDSTRDVSIKSNTLGNRIVLAGWEINKQLEHTPVLWRYEIPSTIEADEAHTTQLTVIDSIRFPHTAPSSAVLHFSANASLDKLALGWQQGSSATHSSDSALITYQYSSTSMRWFAKLDLREAFPTPETPLLLRSVRLSPDGETMAFGTLAGGSITDINRVGGLVILR